MITLLFLPRFRQYGLGLISYPHRPLRMTAPYRIVKYLGDGVLSHHHAVSEVRPGQHTVRPFAASGDFPMNLGRCFGNTGDAAH